MYVFIFHVYCTYFMYNVMIMHNAINALCVYDMQINNNNKDNKVGRSAKPYIMAMQQYVHMGIEIHVTVL